MTEFGEPGVFMAFEEMTEELIVNTASLGFDLVNKPLTKKEITNVIDQVYRHCGQKETVIFCDRLMGLGFHQAFKAGISFGKDDLIVPHAKAELVATIHTQAKREAALQSDRPRGISDGDGHDDLRQSVPEHRNQTLARALAIAGAQR